MAAVWAWFSALSKTRQPGMGIGPITYLEIEAYQRLEIVRMTAWEVGLIRRLDDAVRVVMSDKPSAPAAAETIKPDIPIQNTGAIKTLFRGLAAQKQAQLQAEEAAHGSR